MAELQLVMAAIRQTFPEFQSVMFCCTINQNFIGFQKKCFGDLLGHPDISLTQPRAFPIIPARN
jgi:hypothetical protein